jgi:hypothetical protein
MASMRPFGVMLAALLVALVGWPVGCILSRKGHGDAGTVGGDPSGGGGMGASGGGAAGAGGEAEGGGGTAGSGPIGGGCGGGNADYEIYLKGTAPIDLDGNCNEPAWDAARSLSFTSGDSDNTGTCRLLWEDGQPDRIYGCCELGDTSLQAIVATNDTDGIWDDDAIELYVKGNLDPVTDGTTTRVIVNLLGHFRDTNYPGGMVNLDHAASVAFGHLLHGELNDEGAVDAGYGVEWRQTLAFEAQPDLIGLCEFILNDRDDDTPSAFYTFSDATSSFDPGTWGTCKYSCLYAAP